MDAQTSANDLTRRIVGRVYDDDLPRVVEINRYHMDIVPSGDMILLLNEDRPGMIGLVGTQLGEAGINIADMSISRRETPGGEKKAMMVLKIDEEASPEQLDSLRRPGILRVAAVKLPPV